MFGTLQDLRCLAGGISWVRDIRPEHRAGRPGKHRVPVDKKMEFLSQLFCRSTVGHAITPDRLEYGTGATKIGPNFRAKKTPIELTFLPGCRLWYDKT